MMTPTAETGPLAAYPAGVPQRTLGKAVQRLGRGLHTGAEVSVRLLPAPENSGICFRVDGRDYPLSAERVCSTDRCTSLALGSAEVQTVEHLLAALHGMAVDNAVVETVGPELPALDGSAIGWVEAIQEAGVIEQGAEAVSLVPVCSFATVDDGSCLVVEPADRLSVTCVLHYEHRLLGTMVGTYPVEPSTFPTVLARARTYGFYEEVQSLLSRGQALGGSLDNALVIFEDRFSSELRYPDELVRHKVLDLLGDLYVLGRRFTGHITAIRPGHRVNRAFVSALAGQRAPVT